jgi:hypothetical protein
MPILNRHSMEIPQISSTISRENDVLFPFATISVVVVHAFIYLICTHLPVLMSNTIFISDDIHVV